MDKKERDLMVERLDAAIRAVEGPRFTADDGEVGYALLRRRATALAAEARAVAVALHSSANRRESLARSLRTDVQRLRERYPNLVPLDIACVIGDCTAAADILDKEEG